MPSTFLRSSLLRLVVAPAVALAVAGCASAPAGPHAADAVAQLTAQADRWDKAIVAKDRSGIESNMAEDFRQIDGAGNVESKRSFVEDLLSPALTIDPYSVEEFEVRLYGAVALLSGCTRMTGRYEGKPFATHYRYIDVYVRRDGAWRIVSVQISRLPQ